MIYRKTQDAGRTTIHDALSRWPASGFAMPYLGQRDQALPWQPPDLVPRSAMAGYPTNFSKMTDDDIEERFTSPNNHPDKRSNTTVRASTPPARHGTERRRSSDPADTRGYTGRCVAASERADTGYCLRSVKVELVNALVPSHDELDGALAKGEVVGEAPRD